MGTLNLSSSVSVNQYNIFGPAFHATKNNIQSLTNNVWTKIAFDDESFDATNEYDAVTNYRFLPSVAGYYIASITLNCTSTDFLVGIFRNGGEYLRGRNNYQQATVTQMVYLNGTTDYIEPYGYVTSTGQISSGSGVENQFSAALIRPVP